MARYRTPNSGEASVHANNPTWYPTATLDALRLRARLNATLRDFFAQRGVLEVETPVLSIAGNTDRNIESFSLQFTGPVSAGPRERWLRTSPEFALKRLLAAGIGDCYELGRVFRNGEAGARHNPEFTMLEWYRAGWDHHRLMDEVADVVNAALALVGRRVGIEKIAYRALFQRVLGFDPLTASIETLQAPLSDVRIDPVGLTRDDWLDLLLTHRIEPTFDRDTLLLVHDYPASQCALARLRGDGDVYVAERFEAYLGARELANGYHELGDAAEQRARFEADLAVRAQRGTVQPPLDEHLLSALEHGLPACAGVAMGIDRLMGVLLDSERIADTLAFGFDRA